VRGQGHVRRRMKADGSPGSWQVIVDAGRDPDTGKRRVLSGSAPSKRAAIELRNALLARADRLNGLEREAPAGAATVAELFDEFIVVGGGSVASRRIYRGAFDRHLRPRIGAIPARDLRARDLNAVYAAMTTAGLKPATVRKVHTVASAMCTYGCRHEWMADNPARKADPPALRKTTVRPTPLPETAALIRELDGTPVGLLVLASAALGTRRGETLGLQWGDFDFERGQVTIQRRVTVVPGGIEVESSTKNGTERTIAVDAVTLGRFAAHLVEAQATAAVAGFSLSPGAFVFARDLEGRVPWHPSTATHKLAAIRRRLGLSDAARLHGLRHYVATSLLTAKVDVRTVAERLGNGPDVVLSTYSHFVPAADQEAAQILGNALGQRTEGLLE
jgi:integrase